MTIARELIERYQPLYHSKTVDLNEMAGWYNRAREFLEQIDVADEVGDLIDLAYLVGSGERELMRMIAGCNRAVAIRHGRQAVDMNWDAPLEERAEAAAKAHRLKSEGIRNFIARVANEYGKDPKTIRKWMKQYPPQTRD